MPVAPPVAVGGRGLGLGVDEMTGVLVARSGIAVGAAVIVSVGVRPGSSPISCVAAAVIAAVGVSVPCPRSQRPGQLNQTPTALTAMSSIIATWTSDNRPNAKIERCWARAACMRSRPRTRPATESVGQGE